MRLESLLLLIVVGFGACIGILGFRKYTMALKMLAILLVCTFIFEFLAELAAYLYKNNLFVYHFFNPIEYSLFAIIYFFLFEKLVIKRIILITLLFYTPLSIYNSFNWQPYFDNYINSYAILSESILLVFYSLSFLYITMDKHNGSIYKIPAFWMNAGILIFFSTNIFFWGYYNSLIRSEQNLNVFYKILFWENVLLYSLCGISLSIVNRKNDSKWINSV